tara:strand:- start:4438 stop:4626 length:189 start_codon:yes stop_codon:yes gene_type:complete
MQDILTFINELKELQALYNADDLRNYDFVTKIDKYKRDADAYEFAMDDLFKASKSYEPSFEI